MKDPARSIIISNKWASDKWRITRSFGIKPVNGGNPASDNKSRLIVVVIIGLRLNKDISCDLDEIDIKTVNRGIITTEYKMK